MRKILLKTYPVKVVTENGVKEVEYNVKDSLVEILFNKALGLGSVSLLKQNILANKILSSDDEVLLEEEEYQRIKTAIDTVEGLTRNDVIFVERILEAETVDVSEKK